MNVAVSSSYTLLGKNNVDTYGCLYKDYFNPFNPYDNLLFCKNRECNPLEIKLVADLQSSATYVLVVTTDHWNTKGTFDITAFGGSTVTFKDFREYIYMLYG